MNAYKCMVKLTIHEVCVIKIYYLNSIQGNFNWNNVCAENRWPRLAHDSPTRTAYSFVLACSNSNAQQNLCPAIFRFVFKILSRSKRFLSNIFLFLFLNIRLFIFILVLRNYNLVYEFFYFLFYLSVFIYFGDTWWFP